MVSLAFFLQMGQEAQAECYWKVGSPGQGFERGVQWGWALRVGVSFLKHYSRTNQTAE